MTAPSYELADLVTVVRRWQAAGERVALCHGCFDLLHYGHALHLAEARGLADRLVVTVTPDRFVNKGPGRPAFTAEQRAYMLGSLRTVDAVAINNWPTAIETLHEVRPDLYVKGVDYTGPGAEHPGLVAERAAAGAVGARLVLTGTPKWSSTDLLGSVAAR